MNNIMMKIFLYSIMSLVLLLSGCSFVEKLGITRNTEPIEGGVGAAHQDQTEQQLPTAEASIDNQLPAKKIEHLTIPSYEKLLPKTPLPELEAIDPEKLVLEDKPVMINVDGMPLSDFITYAIGDTLKVTYFIDEAVKDIKTPITFRMAKKVRAETAFEIAIDILRQHDIIVEQSKGSLYILKSKPERAAPLDLRVGRSVEDSEAKIVQLVPLKHIKPRDIEGFILKIYEKKSANVRSYHNENALLLTDTASSIKEIINFIEMFDVPYLQGKKLFMIQLTYWRPDEFIKQLTTIIGGIGFKVAKSSKDPGISFIPIKTLNSILVIAPDDKAMKFVIEWKEKLDTPESAGTEEKAFTYKPLYSKASDLVDAIKSLYGVALPAKKENAKARVTPSIIPGLKIDADDSRNLVVIITVPSTYQSILSLLKELDTPPRQVLLEATVAELTLKDDLQYGLEFFLKNSYDKGPFEFSTIGGLGLVPGGLSFNYLSDSGKFGALIEAFAKNNMIKVLSKPRLMVLDNEQATINVGTDVPVVTGEATTPDIVSAPGTTASSILRNIQFVSTGITLNVTPTINTEDTLTLVISIDLDEAQTNAFSNIDSPMILTRRIKTKIVVASSKSVMLGGLMRENKNTTINKIPILGDIPFLGYLFKNTSKSTDSTELIIIITPTILTTTDDATRLTEELKKELKWLK